MGSFQRWSPRIHRLLQTNGAELSKANQKRNWRKLMRPFNSSDWEQYPAMESNNPKIGKVKIKLGKYVEVEADLILDDKIICVAQFDSADDSSFIIDVFFQSYKFDTHEMAKEHICQMEDKIFNLGDLVKNHNFQKENFI
jgi:hypothetical protein